MFPEGRLFDFLIVGIVALIVVGPKDLPLLMRKVGQFMAKVRGMASEFRASFDELARQSELDELRREVQALRTARPADYVAKHIGAGDVFAEINADLAATNRQLAAATAIAEPSPPAAAPEPPPPGPATPEPSPGPKAAAE
jgi:sec-independent protein translocase protein TatB